LVDNNFLRSEPFIRKEGWLGFVKRNFKALKGAQVFPGGWRVIGVRGVHSFKPIIIDDMILGGDVPSFEVADQTDRLCMNR